MGVGENEVPAAAPLLELPPRTADGHRPSARQNEPQKINTSSRLAVCASLSAEGRKGLRRRRSTEHGLAAAPPSAQKCSFSGLGGQPLITQGPLTGSCAQVALPDHPAGAVPKRLWPCLYFLLLREHSLLTSPS